MFRKDKKLGLFYQTKFIYANDAATLCYLASKSCYGTSISNDINIKLKYIRARMKEAHESIIEHSNVVMLLRIPRKSKAMMADFVMAAHGLHYLQYSTVKSSKYINILIGGSIRGYKNFIRDNQDQTNKIVFMVKEVLYESCYRDFFVDLIDAGVMMESFIEPGVNNSDFYNSDKDIELTPEQEAEFQKRINEEADHTHRPFYSSDPKHIDIINIDPVKEIYGKVKQYGFILEDVLKVASITIYFKGMSRIITQQLTRHRNAITQESQRYVDYTDSMFNSPALFKDKYDLTTKYPVDFSLPNQGSLFNGEFTLDEIGYLESKIYGQLHSAGLEKEDARGFLPNNTQSNLYITFTYTTLIHFLKLRTDSHAQAEIRMYANIILEDFQHYLASDEPDIDSANLFDYLIPRCMFSEIEREVIVDEEVTSSIPTDPESDIPQRVDTSEDAIDRMYEAFNGNRYAETRDDTK